MKYDFSNYIATEEKTNTAPAPRTTVEKRLVNLFGSSSRKESFSYDEWVEWASAHGANDKAIAAYWEEAEKTTTSNELFKHLNIEEEKEKLDENFIKYEYIKPKKVNKVATFGDAGTEMSFTGSTRKLRAYLKDNCPNFYRTMFVSELNKPNSPTYDWFSSYDREYLQERLAANGFAWTREVVRLRNPDKKEEKNEVAADWNKLNELPEE